MGVNDRRIYLYDTFEGMSEPTLNDIDLKGISAQIILSDSDINQGKEKDSIWCIASIEDVEKNLKSTSYPYEYIHLIKGKVENTLLNSENIKDISLLRLDTDWYESTKIEMEELFPKLNKNGVLIIDDYGHWMGAKKAIDEYFSIKKLNYLLYKIDYTGRLLIKI
jgi:hypothetical protein